eukprot:CAMPEP_0171978554 /NCGR_PEP_ID=MMETSP0993-20121228/252550_1 /TAXON_ID=483369 /ORGANISM="non described non described, Strain CCMP2098" /LENGTH=31 /DNA_ID= /DNA_START= /DNA_END= /DNA_ORIENTATION=
MADNSRSPAAGTDAGVASTSTMVVLVVAAVV